MNIIITGEGEEINFLIKSFLEKGHNITIINKNKEFCNKIARTYESVDVVLGDSSKPHILEEAGAFYKDTLISLKSRDQDNLIVCQLAKDKFKIPKTLAVVKNPKNIDLFKKLGLDTVISTTSIISSIIEQKISVEEITNLIEVEEGKASIIQLNISKNFPIIGKSLMEIELPKQAVVGCILRNYSAIIPRGDTQVLENDKLIIIYLPEVEKELFSVLKGSAL